MDRYNNFMKPYPNTAIDEPISQLSIKEEEEEAEEILPLLKEFLRIYELTIQDYQTFTPEIQLQWCEILIQVSRDEAFISQYTINGEKLTYKLNTEQMNRNCNIIIEHSMKVMTKLIRLKYGPAYYLMGCLYSHKYKVPITFLDHDDTKALEYYDKGAKLKHSECCYRCGICYEYGKGCVKDINKAIRYYELGAMKCNNYDCMFRLGHIYLYELQDVKEGMKWYEMAQLHGSNHACFEMGKIYEFNGLNDKLKFLLNDNKIFKDYKLSLKYYYRCAMKYNYSLAQWKLGYCYEQGLLGLPINGIKSLSWYYKSVTNNDKIINIMSVLGITGWYITGIPGVMNPNWSQALQWAIKACNTVSGNQTSVKLKAERCRDILLQELE
ncbi:hypothetical protein MOUN0_O04786 [Monosporozyma unispora]|nr:hypothetical protein C6P44_004090 [Kazachstania unispora]